jgi:serine/threonine protein kinase
MNQFTDLVSNFTKKTNTHVTELISSGTSAKVYRVVSKQTGEQYAVKIINLKPLNKDMKARAFNEAILLKNICCGHPNIIKIYDFIEDNNFLFIIMEYIDCDLLTYVNSQCGGLVESETRLIFTQMVSVLQYLHSLLVVHGDIKLENFLYNRVTRKIVLIDFGSATLLKKKNTKARHHVRDPPVRSPRSFDRRHLRRNEV